MKGGRQVAGNNLVHSACREEAMIIDTHQHLWDLDRVAYPWLVPEFGPNRTDLRPRGPRAAAGAAGVTHTVLVQSANSYADTEYMFEQAVASPVHHRRGRAGCRCCTPTWLAAAFERFRRNPRFVGMRHLIHNEADPHWLLQDRVIEGLKLLAERDLTFDVVATTHEHLECIPVLGERIPDLKMVIDHLGQPPISSGTLGPVGRGHADRGAEPERLRQDFGPGHRQRDARHAGARTHIRPYVDFVLDTFGPDRCMTGGDWPVCVLAGGYGKAWRTYRARRLSPGHSRGTSSGRGLLYTDGQARSMARLL